VERDHFQALLQSAIHTWLPSIPDEAGQLEQLHFVNKRILVAEVSSYNATYTSKAKKQAYSRQADESQQESGDTATLTASTSGRWTIPMPSAVVTTEAMPMVVPSAHAFVLPGQSRELTVILLHMIRLEEQPTRPTMLLDLSMAAEALLSLERGTLSVYRSQDGEPLAGKLQLDVQRSKRMALGQLPSVRLHWKPVVTDREAGTETHSASLVNTSDRALRLECWVTGPSLVCVERLEWRNEKQRDAGVQVLSRWLPTFDSIEQQSLVRVALMVPPGPSTLRLRVCTK
jgi:hypothetical protein